MHDTVAAADHKEPDAELGWTERHQKEADFNTTKELKHKVAAFHQKALLPDEITDEFLDFKASCEEQMKKRDHQRVLEKSGNPEDM